MTNYETEIWMRAYRKGFTDALETAKGNQMLFQKAERAKLDESTICEYYTEDERCRGTKELDPVNCGGDRRKCIYAHK